jgi:hypothetical protein
MPEKRLLRRQGQYVAKRNLRFGPLENENTARLQDSKALGKSLPKHRLPVSIQHAIELGYIASGFISDNVWRVENDQAEGVVIERQRGEVAKLIGIDSYRGTRGTIVPHLMRLSTPIDE